MLIKFFYILLSAKLLLVNSFLFQPVINPILSVSQLVLAKTGLELLQDSKLDANTTRKMIHITCAPTFLSSLNLYNDYNPKLWATSVPFLATLFLIYKSDNLSKIISRSGDTKEIFKGPLIYTLMLTLFTYYYWKNNPIGMIAMIQLSVGDGFADLAGRKFGKNKWFFNSKKSIEGTFGFFITSFLFTEIFINNLYHFNYGIEKIFIISLVSSLIETLPKIDDNISIPFSVLFVDKILNN